MVPSLLAFVLLQLFLLSVLEYSEADLFILSSLLLSYDC